MAADQLAWSRAADTIRICRAVSAEPKIHCLDDRSRFNNCSSSGRGKLAKDFEIENENSSPSWGDSDRHLCGFRVVVLL